jgi:hypothetical protein
MSDEDGSYAPKSPDLSSFYTPGPTADPAPHGQYGHGHDQINHSQPSIFSSQHHYYNDQLMPLENYQQPQSRHSTSHHYSYQPPSESLYNSTAAQPQAFGYSSTAHHDYCPPRAASYPTTNYPQPGTGYAAAQQSQHHQQSQQPQTPHQPYHPPWQRQSLSYSSGQPPPYPSHSPSRGSVNYDSRGPVHYEPPIPAPRDDQHSQYFSNSTNNNNPGNNEDNHMPPRRAAAAAAAAAVASQAASDATPDHQTHSSSTSTTAAPSISGSGAIEPAPVKTKFPTARIKRIMQADEEVGKVAQQTPIAVGKALELFMIALVTRSAEVARQRNSKRVSAQMLKQVVESDDQWDFLREIVAKVEHEEKGGKGQKARTHSQSQGGGGEHASDSDEDMEGAGKKRGRGGGRKKKV